MKIHHPMHSPQTQFSRAGADIVAEGSDYARRADALEESTAALLKESIRLGALVGVLRARRDALRAARSVKASAGAKPTPTRPPAQFSRVHSSPAGRPSSRGFVPSPRHPETMTMIRIGDFVVGAVARCDTRDPRALTADQLRQWIADTLPVHNGLVHPDDLIEWLSSERTASLPALCGMTARGLRALVDNLPRVEGPTAPPVPGVPGVRTMTVDAVADLVQGPERVLAVAGLVNALRRDPMPLVDALDTVTLRDDAGYLVARKPRDNPAGARVDRALFAIWLTSSPEGAAIAKRHPDIPAHFEDAEPAAATRSSGRWTGAGHGSCPTPPRWVRGGPTSP